MVDKEELLLTIETFINETRDYMKEFEKEQDN